MSLLDTASLIVTPNGYKEGKLYSVIPSDGSGDMSVVRATTATRVNSAGLVELVPYNLVTYSNTFSNAAWTKNNTTVTSGQSGYDGTSNAWKLQATATTNCEVDQGFSESETKNFSIYAKAGNVNFVAISVFGAGFGWYNLSNGTLGSSGGTFVSRNIESVGNGWYRCSIVTNVATSGVAVYVADADNSITTSVGSNIFIQNSQLESGNVPTTYQKTETRLNIPRLDYSNGTCPSLLVEPQRTNLLTYSSSFDNVAWTKINATITANNTTAPDGNLTADTFTDNSTSGSHAFVRFNSWSTTQQTASIYVKPNTLTKFYISNSTTGRAVCFDLTTSTIEGYTNGSGSALTNASIENVGNGWFRLSATNTATASQSLTFGFYKVFTSSSFDAMATYVGTGETAYLWGAQLELGSYQTSYIPTQAATVTRNADVISKTGIADLIGQTEGTCFVDFIHNGADITTFQAALFVSSGDPSNLINIGVYDGRLNPAITASSVGIFDVYVGPNPLPQGRHKVAIAYKSGDFAIYLNGTQVYTNTNSATFGTMSQVDLGTILSLDRQLGDGINSAALYKTRLTNAELATLTTI